MATLKFLIFVVLFAVGGNTLTFQEKYEIWSQDLKPGFIIEQSVMDGRKCYCKVPKPTTFMTSTTTTVTPPNSTTTTPTTKSTSTTTPTTTSTSTTTTPTTTSTSTTTTPTTTSTSTTTTPTTTSTTTTPTTTSTSTTTTTTSTTTTPTTTTTATTTTAAAAIDCGANCNVEIHANKDNFNVGSNYVYWTSPNYPNNYPDGCECTLTVYLESYGFVAVSFDSGSTIYARDNCAYDRLTLVGDLNINGQFCGDQMSTVKGNMFKTRPGDISFTSVFTADFGDGNTVAKGFRMKIYIEIWGWRRSLKESGKKILMSQKQ